VTATFRKTRLRFSVLYKAFVSFRLKSSLLRNALVSQSPIAAGDFTALSLGGIIAELQIRKFQ
jgi:hypothetical protein